MTQIEKLIQKLSNSQVSITPSDNKTTYYEWETKTGFVSLEIGDLKYAFSYIPDKKDEESFGLTGSLEKLDDLEQLIKEYQN